MAEKTTNAKRLGFDRIKLLLREQMDSSSTWLEIKLPGKGGSSRVRQERSW